MKKCYDLVKIGDCKHSSNSCGKEKIEFKLFSVKKMYDDKYHSEIYYTTYECSNCGNKKLGMEF